MFIVMYDMIFDVIFIPICLEIFIRLCGYGEIFMILYNTTCICCIEMYDEICIALCDAIFIAICDRVFIMIRYLFRNIFVIMDVNFYYSLDYFGIGCS